MRYLQRLIERRLLVDGSVATGLDVGCGQASVLTSLRGPRFRSTGIDANERSLAAARAANAHDEYLCADVRTLSLDRPFDVIVLSNVIEHFARDEGLDLLRHVERLARRIVCVETPHGFLEQTDLDGNPHQRHLSGWFPHDFEARGYTVFGIGPRWLRGPVGKARLFPEPITRALSRGLQWLYFRRPHRAGVITALRYIDEHGNVRRL